MRTIPPYLDVATVTKDKKTATKTHPVRVNEVSYERLLRIADAFGLTVADYLDTLIEPFLDRDIVEADRIMADRAAMVAKIKRQQKSSKRTPPPPSE